MIELNREQLEAKCRAATDRFALFFYTPLCGTCKVGERMLSITEAMMPGLALFRCNVNAMPAVAQRWKIQSVPCLLSIRAGEPERVLYAFQSVENIYRFLQAGDFDQNSPG